MTENEAASSRVCRQPKASFTPRIRRHDNARLRDVRNCRNHSNTLNELEAITTLCRFRRFVAEYTHSVPNAVALLVCQALCAKVVGATSSEDC